MVDFRTVNEGRRYLYDLLSRLYEREVDEGLLDELTSAAESGDLARRFEQLANLDERVGRGIDLLIGYLRSAAGRPKKEVLLELAAEYASLFLSVKGKPPHPSESVYRSASHLMYQEQRDEVLELYREMGVDKVKEFREPEDHIAVELSFLSYLIGRSLEEWERGNLGEARRFLEVQRKFLEEHLLKWVHQFVEDIISSAEVDFYKGVAYLTDGFLEMDWSSMDQLVSLLASDAAGSGRSGAR